MEFKWSTPTTQNDFVNGLYVQYEETYAVIDDRTDFGVCVRDRGKAKRRKKNTFEIIVCEFERRQWFWPEEKQEIATKLKTELFFAENLDEARMEAAKMTCDYTHERLEAICATISKLEHPGTKWQEVPSNSASYIHMWRRDIDGEYLLQLGQMANICIYSDKKPFNATCILLPPKDSDEPGEVIYQTMIYASSENSAKSAARRQILANIDKNRKRAESAYLRALKFQKEHTKATYCKAVLLHISDTLATTTTTAAI